MNAYSLVNLVASRIPSYDQTEYLREVNTAYQECWNYILQLDDSYFTDIKIVTVASQAAEFDFLYNSNAALNNPVSNRYFQIDRIRVLQPNDTNWIPALPRSWNDPQFQQIQQSTPQQPAVNPPYLYIPFAKGSALFARPFSAGTQIEIVYTFIYIPLTIVSSGTVTSSGAVVTGTGTTFTQLLQADYQSGLPGNDQDTDVGIELALGGNQTYRVKTVTSDTALVTLNSISPAVTGANFNLAMVPDIPEGHHEVIALSATKMMALTPARDFNLYNAMNPLVEVQMEAMQDTIMTRQRQEPARRRRFPQSVLRYQVTNISR